MNVSKEISKAKDEEEKIVSKSKTFLTMYNMSHGDSYLLHNNEMGLLIDCGNNFNSHINIKTIVPLIESDLLTKKCLSAVFTHMHSDHINRIKNLNKKIIFQEIFISNLFSPSDITILFYILKAYSKKSLTYQKAYNYLLLIPNISSHLKVNSTINFVSLGNTISVHTLCSMEVLWPARSDHTIEFTSGFHFTKTESELINQYIQILKNTTNYDNENKILSFKSDSSIIEIRELNTVVINFVSNLNNDIESSDNEKKELKRFANKTSLVIHECFKSLFLADITKSIYLSYIKSKTSGYYKFLKTPHHGTSNAHYFTSSLPRSRYALINEDRAMSRYSHMINYLGYKTISDELVLFDITRTGIPTKGIKLIYYKVDFAY